MLKSLVIILVSLSFSFSHTTKPFGKYGTLCIKNNTDRTISYSYRWGTEEWQYDYLSSGYTQTHSWPYSNESYSSPSFQIKYDEDLSSHIYTKTYELERVQSNYNECEYGKQYKFVIEGSSYNQNLKFYSIN